MPDATHYRKTEMDARFVPADTEGRAFRVSAEGFLQLKDSANAQFRSLWLADGVPQSGPAED